MPVEFPTSCVFGGENLTDLYITSAWTELGEEGKAAPALGRRYFLAAHRYSRAGRAILRGLTDGLLMNINLIGAAISSANQI